jgi:hypothetical protein
LLNGGIYKENLYPLHQYAFIVCALFTPGKPKYYQYVDRLAASCEKYGLPYSIYEVPGVHTSINLDGTDNLTFTKANFIAHNMERFTDKNLLYVDADIFFTDYPKIIVEISNARFDIAIYNWLNDEHNEAYMPIMKEVEGKALFSEFYVYSHHIAYYSDNQMICSGGVQFYRNSSSVRQLLDAWQEVIAQNPCSADDECLDYAYNNFDYDFKKLKPAWLDKSYLRLPWWPHVKPVILHPGLPIAGKGRNPLPERNNKKRFYPEHCRKKSIPLYFPSDYVIDTERRLLLKIQNSQVIDVQEIQQEFWIYQEHE